MAALNGLGFAIQAVDVTARSALGLHRNYRDRRDERAQRLSEYLSTIDEYEAAIQGLNIGGGPPVVSANHPLRLHLQKMMNVFMSMQAVFNEAGPQDSAPCEDTIRQHVLNEVKWAKFLDSKMELRKLEKSLHFYSISQMVRYRCVMTSHTGCDSRSLSAHRQVFEVLACSPISTILLRQFPWFVQPPTRCPFLPPRQKRANKTRPRRPRKLPLNL
jgi:hypothetical protein